MGARKKQRTSKSTAGIRSDQFDRLPDDLVISILCKLSSSAPSPSDFFSVLITCKRMNRLGLNSLVLNQAGSKTLAVRERNWCEPAHRFLRRCVSVGNVEASYILGMIRFYCLQNRTSGLSLLAKAAIKSHAPALYSLAVIQFNGSGGTKSHKDLRTGIAFFARAASLGHVDALRELGHCLQDGYGVPRNVLDGRRFLVQANARELASSLRDSDFSTKELLSILQAHRSDGVLLLRELNGHQISITEPHPANKFLVEWFESVSQRHRLEPGLRLCSNTGCGRPETRVNEFRRCSACGMANYCSRGCQARDWKVRHKLDCAPLEFDPLGFDVEMNGGDGGNDVEGGDRVVEVGGAIG